MNHRDRVYGLEEARALVPQVRAILLQLAFERRRADAAHEALHGELLTSADGLPPDLAEYEAATEERWAGARALLEHLQSLGVILRDLETGLVDFPTIRDGEPAWLCWRLADPELAWWHTTSEGFASRRPI